VNGVLVQGFLYEKWMTQWLQVERISKNLSFFGTLGALGSLLSRLFERLLLFWNVIAVSQTSLPGGKRHVWPF